VNKEFYQEWPITMGLVGNFHNLALFFDKVSRLPRLVNVGNLKINSLGAQTVSNTIGVGSTATTFVYIETPPGGAKPPAAGAR
jgi:type IV pilus assembly protein PilO